MPFHAGVASELIIVYNWLVLKSIIDLQVRGHSSPMSLKTQDLTCAKGSSDNSKPKGPCEI